LMDCNGVDPTGAKVIVDGTLANPPAESVKPKPPKGRKPMLPTCTDKNGNWQYKPFKVSGKITMVDCNGFTPDGKLIPIVKQAKAIKLPVCYDAAGQWNYKPFRTNKGTKVMIDCNGFTSSGETPTLRSAWSGK
ncbi:MAG: hypothetical protein ACRCXZ_05770, partial [Patescibacteria group bacterium]